MMMKGKDIVKSLNRGTVQLINRAHLDTDSTPSPRPALREERAGVRGFDLENNEPPHPDPLLPWGRRGRKTEAVRGCALIKADVALGVFSDATIQRYNDSRFSFRVAINAFAEFLISHQS